MDRRFKKFILGALVLGLLSPGAVLAQTTTTNYDIAWDTFTSGLQMGTSTSKWNYFSNTLITTSGASHTFTADDAITSPLSNGLYVKSSGWNNSTQRPAFNLSVPSENVGVQPGALDHVKWLVYMNNMASTNVPGFDAVLGKELSCSTRIIGQTFGTRLHPFGSKAATNDLRLAAFAMNTIDFESFMVFDFMFTNKRIYAIYERLPFGRTQTDNYAAFTFAIPLGARSAGTAHDVKIAYDRSAGIVRWILDGKEVYRVSTIGRRINRRYMIIDHGGIEKTVAPRQLNCGMGMFTLLDGSDGSQPGLVRLSNRPNFYFSPSRGEPSLQSFVDETSQPGSRIFGQGVEFRIGTYRVASTTVGAAPAPAPTDPPDIITSPDDTIDKGDGMPTYEPLP
jgi:hypothetical protein